MFCACFCALAELSAAYLFPRISRVQSRLNTERRAIRDLHSGSGCSAVLFVGNSLFEKGIDIPQMASELPGFTVKRYAISDTSYEDWFFGLRRLFAEGVRPQTVVVGLSASQLIVNRIEGDLSAHMLVRASDLPLLGRELALSNTALSDLYFAHFSAFYGTRTQFRKWLLGRVLPDIDLLGAAVRPPTRTLPDAATVELRATERLSAMNELCQKNGSRLILVVPPVPDHGADAIVAAVEEAGRRTGVPVLVPVRPGVMPPEMFSDGFHLNSSGAMQFTSILAAELKHSIPDALARNARR
jgi:hypothetical protein